MKSKRQSMTFYDLKLKTEASIPHHLHLQEEEAMHIEKAEKKQKGSMATSRIRMRSMTSSLDSRKGRVTKKRSMVTSEKISIQRQMISLALGMHMDLNMRNTNRKRRNTGNQSKRHAIKEQTEPIIINRIRIVMTVPIAVSIILKKTEERTNSRGRNTLEKTLVNNS